MTLLIAGLALVLAAGVLAEVAARRGRLPTEVPALVAGGVLVGSLLGSVAAGAVLFGGAAAVTVGGGAAPVPGLDYLSAVFLLPALVVAGLGGLSGAGEWGRAGDASAARLTWGPYAGLVLATALALTAKTVIVFALGWGGIGLTWAAAGGFRRAKRRGPGFVAAVGSALIPSAALYGVLRAIALARIPPTWWGAGAVGLGAVLCVGGALRTFRAYDLRQSVRGWSVQHAGVVGLAAGLGALALRAGQVDVALLAFAAGLLHGLSRVFFTALLGLATSAVEQGCGSTRLERVAGVFRRMRDTGVAYLAGAGSAAALPPTGGVAGPVLLIAAGVAGLRNWPILAPAARLALLAASIAAIVGVMTFGRGVRAGWSSDARTPAASAAREVGSVFRVPMHLLSAACIGLGLFPALALVIVARAAVQLAAPAGVGMATAMDVAFALARWVGLVAWAVVGVAALAGAVSAARARLPGLLRRSTAGDER